MNGSLRRVFGALTAGLLVSGLLVVVAATGAGAQAGGVSFKCEIGKNTRVAFWPEGHVGIQTDGFPDTTDPHAELYEGRGKTYPDELLLAVVQAGFAMVNPTHPDCEELKVIDEPSDPKKAKTATEAATITCKAKNPTVTVVEGDTESVLIMRAGEKTVIIITIGASPEAVYNRKLCKESLPPE